MKESEYKQIRILVLQDGQHLERKIFRLQKGQVVQFVLSGSLFSRKVRLYCNHIQNESDVFNRYQYYKLKWQNPSRSVHDDSNRYAALPLLISGTFHYYFTLDGAKEAAGSGYLLVDPVLVTADGNEISLDSLQCQTVLSKCLGTFPEWIDRIRVTAESGFNMIHFTPLQELSHESNSSYAIHNHLAYNPAFGAITKEQMLSLMDTLYQKYDLMSVTDLVYNHVAKGCPLLEKHPEAAYNLENSPHLKPAFLFDRIVYHFSKDVGEGLLESAGIPSKIDHGHLYPIRQYLLHQLLPKYNFHEFVTVDIDKIVEEFRERITAPGVTQIPASELKVSDVRIIQDKQYRRLASSIDFDVAVKSLNATWDDVSGEDRVNRCCDILRQALKDQNTENRNKITGHVVAGVENCISHCRYWFFEAGESCSERICAETPLAPSYFYYPFSETTLHEEEEAMYDDSKAARIMAYNGWTPNNDPLKSFAEEGSNVYLRRELIAWGDLIKVRYGDKFEDCPHLWKYMEKYTIDTVEVFRAVRLDNCHSTPLHVAEYMLDVARQLRNNIYVFGELFTGNEELDNIFVNRLGITSLVRESMSSFSPYDFGRQIFRYGGQPVGAFYNPPVRPITSGIAHAMFYDVTHDNMCPITTYCIYDMLPRMFLTSMTCCSIGSSRGYDELVPHHISVVTEKRLYRKWADKPKPDDNSSIDMHCGIIAARFLANKLHMSLREEGFTQIYVDQVTSDVIAVTRHNPSTHNSIVLVARTAFSMPEDPDFTGYIRPLFIPGLIEEVMFEAEMERVCTTECDTAFIADRNYINGLPNSTFKLSLKRHINPAESRFVQVAGGGDFSLPDRSLEFKYFPPGCVIAFRVSLPDDVKAAVYKIRKAAREFCTPTAETICSKSFLKIVSALSLHDLNLLLYRCSPEEMDDGHGSNVYNIPNYGDLVYAGLQGFMSVMEKVRLTNDMGHPICENLRNGNWIMDYVANRLMLHRNTKEIGEWFHKVFHEFHKLPRYLVPAYFDAILTGAYTCITEHSWNQMPKFIRFGSTLLRALAMVSMQLVGNVQSAKMPPLSPYLPSPKPETYIDETTRKTSQRIASLSAGLTHFSVGAFRNWGRDTFISLRGLLLLTGRYEDARFIILSYGQCLRHGLIPNLLGEGIGARYNCRDAFWWWLYSIKCYVDCVDEGHKILEDPCSMLYPSDESPACEPGTHDQPLKKVIQLGLQRHVQKMSFRERGAGYQLDNNMSDEGFNVEIGVDMETGFVYGGNQHNCGTWMDKMGSSEKAGNKGKPATPRDGSAVEIVGLSKACLDWLCRMNEKGWYPFDGIEYQAKGTKKTLLLKDWSSLIEKNFEKYFWIDENKDSPYIKKEYVNRRGIYKDSVNSSFGWTDYQLRPNFLITLVVAPNMCDVEHAWTAICKAEEILMGNLGVKTLDPSDLNYVPDYDNSNDSTDMKVAHGWGYHQGPEWLWLTGYLYRAMLNFASIRERTHRGCIAEALTKVKAVFGRLHDKIMASDWKGLPELTNANGAYCPFSCETQAWTAASLLELMQHVSGMA